MPVNPGADDQTLRHNRMIFYEDDIEELDTCLSGFIERSQSNCALLIDVEGHLVTKQGFTNKLDTTTIAALVAGSFASTRALAKSLGEKEFSVVFHQGKNESIHISLVAERCLIVILFDDRTTIGMVRHQANEVIDELGAIIKTMEKKSRDRPNPIAGEKFQAEAESRIDDFFGDE